MEEADGMDETIIITQEANNAAHGAGPAALLIQKDEVYGDFCLPPYCAAIVNSAPFRRLGRLKQLGLAHVAFPGAVHTRYQHSLGVAHLGHKVVRHLYDTQRGALGDVLDERAIRHITLAGLCHDLGHGVCSHVFEREFLRSALGIKWDHEAMSLQMLDHLVAECGVGEEVMDAEDAKQIGQYIQGVKPETRAQLPEGKRFLYDIISNDCNGIDVDRLDYLQRDAWHCGVGPLAVCTTSLLSGAKVLADQLCYPASQCGNVWSAFAERGRMFRHVYTSERTKGAELMVVKALVDANGVLGFTRLVERAEDFIHLDDTLLDLILHYDCLPRPLPPAHPHAALLSRLSEPAEDAWEEDGEGAVVAVWKPGRGRNSSSSSGGGAGGGGGGRLGRARELLERVKAGDVYPCVGEVAQLPYGGKQWEAELEKAFTEANVASYGNSNGVVQLTPDILKVHIVKLDYGKKGGANPIDGVGFYPDARCTAPRRADEAMLAGLQLPEYFEERTLRVYVCTSSSSPSAAALRAAAFAAFTRWCEANRGLLLGAWGAAGGRQQPCRSRVMPRRLEGEVEAALFGLPGIACGARQAAMLAADPHQPPTPAMLPQQLPQQQQRQQYKRQCSSRHSAGRCGGDDSNNNGGGGDGCFAGAGAGGDDASAGKGVEQEQEQREEEEEEEEEEMDVIELMTMMVGGVKRGRDELGSPTASSSPASSPPASPTRTR
ncbi:hypothetical protein Agub_g7524 [Astrephomene gubernaculifera]|uniref:HD/PDEase domain-containing protein n=1 Tax=Astrephomene gubernaculifera TaxID=47775 RepID=A0AAD3HLS6_9CHLO|nr:hypothetical protein Agub_g7524 [Astrephomene gubernaculifera]